MMFHSDSEVQEIARSALALLKRQEAQKFLVDENGKITPLPIVYPNCPLKQQESEWLEDSDPGQEYGTTWACRKCHHSIHKPFIWNPYDSGYKYCMHCGARMKVRKERP